MARSIRPPELAIQTAQRHNFELLKIVKQVCLEKSLTYWIDGGTLLGAKRHRGFIPWDDDIDVCLPWQDFDILIEALSLYCQSSDHHLLMFKHSGVPYWTECFADIRLLADGAIPVHIDLIPVKVLENEPVSIEYDRSLAEVATYAFRGFVKQPKALIKDHSLLLSKPHEPMTFRLKVLQMMKDCDLGFSQQLESRIVNYSYNDAMVGKQREYHNFKSIMPLGSIAFETEDFPCPANVDEYLTLLYGRSFMDLPPSIDRKPHFKSLYPNQLSKSETQDLVTLLHQLGVRHLALDVTRFRVWRKVFRRFKSVIMMCMSYTFKAKYRSLQAVLRYAINQTAI